MGKAQPVKLTREQNREFYRSFFSLYIVLVLQNVVTLSVNLADNIMLGSYSEAALSGVAAVNQIQFVFQQLVSGFGEGVVILCTQYWGRKKTEPMRGIFGIGMRAGLSVAVLLFLAVSIFPAQAVGLFTTDEEIIRQGVSYLKIVRFTYLFFAVTQILLATLRSMETVKIAFYLSIMTLFFNCGINWLLIFGHLGCPELGARGAAVGTLTARIVETGVVVIYLQKKKGKVGLTFSDYLPGFLRKKTGAPAVQYDGISARTLRKDYFKVCLPLLASSGIWGINTAMQTVILGHMTSAAIAANSAASTLFLMVKSMAIGAASATSIMIGKAIGMGDRDLVMCYSGKLQRMFVVIGLVAGVLLYFLRIPVLGLYNLSPETMKLANQFLIILSVVEVGMSYQMPTNAGIIRGAGNTMYMLKLDFVCVCIIGLPLSAFMAFVVKASPAIVVCCLNCDQIYKGIPAYLMSHYGNWIHELTR